MAEYTVREVGDQNSLGRNTESGLEASFRQIPGGAHFGRFCAAEHGGVYGTGNCRCPFAAGQAGKHVAERADEVAGQVQDCLEQILHRGASQSLAALRERDLERKHRGKRLPGRTATLARVSQGIRCYRCTVVYYSQGWASIRFRTSLKINQFFFFFYVIPKLRYALMLICF